MRYVIMALLMAVALPAMAAQPYPDNIRSAFINACISRGQGQPVAIQEKLKNACHCAMGKIESLMTQQEFTGMLQTPDHGAGILTPMMQACVVK